MISKAMTVFVMMMVVIILVSAYLAEILAFVGWIIGIFFGGLVLILILKRVLRPRRRYDVHHYWHSQ